MTKFEEEALKEAKKCGYIMAHSKVVFYEDEKGITFIDFNSEHTNFNFPWLEFAKNWHSDEEFQELSEKLDDTIDALDIARNSRDEFEREYKKLKSQLQQQALPVVPECVAGAIESIPNHYSAFEALDLIKSKVETLPEENKDWLPVFNWLCEGIENQDIFALAFITRKYEVEKPKLFYIGLPNVYGLKNKILVSKVENGTIAEFSNGKNYALKFTEQEIKSIDERYWQFAVPVEDGE